MVDINTIRAANAEARRLSDLVAVFVGGNGGIGEQTVKELFRYTYRPTAYIVGRDETRGRSVVEQLLRINRDGKVFFIQKDVSLIRHVDEVCNEIKQREGKLHCLMLTTGYLNDRYRKETEDGIDKKMAVIYYSRMRFIQNLMPLLDAAGAAGELSRVITVLAAGSEAEIRIEDLDLKHDFTLHACLAHCVIMTDFCIEAFAKRHPRTSFSHSFPGNVKTGIANRLSGPVRLAVKVFYAVMTPWIINNQGSGERHFFQLTNQCYPPAQPLGGEKGGNPADLVGTPLQLSAPVARGIDGRLGSGAYLLDWDGAAAGDEAVLEKYRGIGLDETVWLHTQAIFRQAELRRSQASDDAAQSSEGVGTTGFSPMDPPGWRPAW